MEQKKKDELPICDPMICKLILLFTLDKMEFPLTENTIFDICYYRNNWISYMDCKDYLYKLVDANLIYKSEISQMNISDIKVSIHSATIYFLIYGSMKYAAENYNTGYMSSYDITLNGNQTSLRGGSYDEKTLWILNGSIIDSLKAFDEAINEIVNAINN